MIKPYFSKKSMFDMTEKEMFFDGWACALNLKFIKNLIKQYDAVKFERHGEDKYLIVSSSFENDCKYRVTTFDCLGPSGHVDCKTLHMTAKEVLNCIPETQEYIMSYKTI